MPTVSLHPPDPSRGSVLDKGQNPLPKILQTPSGLAILELQGTINIPLPEEIAEESDLLAPTNVGRVVFPDFDPDDVTESTSWMKRVHLYVGQHQRLTGEVKKLPTPLAIIRRKGATSEPSPSGTEELEIAEIIYYKLLFSSRPEPPEDKRANCPFPITPTSTTGNDFRHSSVVVHSPSGNRLVLPQGFLELDAIGPIPRIFQN
ncbi:MAG: hypothetical protein Q9218_006216 [Villophora microphyllina]